MILLDMTPRMSLTVEKRRRYVSSCPQRMLPQVTKFLTKVTNLGLAATSESASLI